MQEPAVLVLVPPSIQGLGVASGFQMQVEDREGVGSDVLQERTQALIDQAVQQPEIRKNTMTFFRAGVPQLYLNIDRVKADPSKSMVSDMRKANEERFRAQTEGDDLSMTGTQKVIVPARAAASIRLIQRPFLSQSAALAR